MQTPPHGHGHHTPSSSASHDAYTQMVSKHCGSFVRLGEKPLHQKRHLSAAPKIRVHECQPWPGADLGFIKGGEANSRY